jgi:SAM-dependent methyltransferase
METTDQQRLWDAAYESKEDFFGIEPSELGKRALHIFQEQGVKEILELGCGQGRDSMLFVKKGFCVVAIDYSSKGIDQAGAKARHEHMDKCLDLRVSDLREEIRMPSESVDAVFSHIFFCMELKEKEIEGIMQECLRVLKPGGLNIYSVRSDHDPQFGKGVNYGEDLYANPMGFVVQFFTEDKIRRLAEGYELLWIREFVEPGPPFPRMLYEVVLRKRSD